MTALSQLKNGNGKLDFVKLITVAFPILVFALIGYLFMSGMLETPEQKSVRAAEMIQRKLFGHEVIAGHPVSIERMRNLQRDVSEMKAQVKKNAATLARIEAKLGR